MEQPRACWQPRCVSRWTLSEGRCRCAPACTRARRMPWPASGVRCACFMSCIKPCINRGCDHGGASIPWTTSPKMQPPESGAWLGCNYALTEVVTPCMFQQLVTICIKTREKCNVSCTHMRSQCPQSREGVPSKNSHGYCEYWKGLLVSCAFRLSMDKGDPHVLSLPLQEGLKGFYRGWTANALKVIPQNSIRFAAYEALRSFLNV